MCDIILGVLCGNLIFWGFFLLIALAVVLIKHERRKSRIRRDFEQFFDGGDNS